MKEQIIWIDGVAPSWHYVAPLLECQLPGARLLSTTLLLFHLLMMMSQEDSNYGVVAEILVPPTLLASSFAAVVVAVVVAVAVAVVVVEDDPFLDATRDRPFCRRSPGQLQSIHRPYHPAPDG